MPSGENDRSVGRASNIPPLLERAISVVIVRIGRPSPAITWIGPAPWTAAIVPSSAWVGECQPPPAVSWTLRAPSGVADHTLPWSMYTIESAFAAAGARSAAGRRRAAFEGASWRAGSPRAVATALPGDCLAQNLRLVALLLERGEDALRVLVAAGLEHQLDGGLAHVEVEALRARG